MSRRADRSEFAGERVELVGRVEERARIDALLDDAAEGLSGTLVIQGQPGIGKTALLEYAGHRAAQFRLLRIAGVESEMAFGYAGVHQLVGPILDHVGMLADHQRQALDAALGRLEHPDLDPYVVALALLSLVGEAAMAQPVVIIVDDAQWLDDESATAIGFVARRLRAERVAMLVAVRDVPEQPVGFERLARLHVDRLSAPDARALVESAADGILDNSVADQLVAASGGNPLALVELPRALTQDQLRGVAPLPDPLPIGRHLSTVFTARLQALSASAQTALLLAATEQMGSPSLFRRAAATMAGLEWDAAAMEAESSGLVRFEPSVRFRHPLVRSAVYYSATPVQRRVVHTALARVLDGADDVDWQAWHLAAAATDPDEQIAAQLAASAERARRQGGVSVAADYLTRAAELTPSPELADARLLEACRAELTAGHVQRAKALLDRVSAHPLGAPVDADAAWTEALVHFVGGHASEAAVSLANVLAITGSEQREIATGSSVAAVAAGLTGGHLVPESSRRAMATGLSLLSARGELPESVRRLTGAVATRWTDGHTACVALREAVTALTQQPGQLEQATGHHLHVVYYAAALAAVELLDDGAWHDLVHAWAHFARRTGALASAPIALGSLSWLEVLQGRFGSAASHLAEIDELVAHTGNRGLLGEPAPALVLREAWHGNEEATQTLVRRMMRDAHDRGHGIGLDQGYAALTVLELGAAHYEAALRYASRVADHDAIPLGVLTLADLVEAAVRTEHLEHVPPALERLASCAAMSATPWARGTLARARATAAAGDDAEQHFATALDELSACSIVTDRARTQLLYGEWLRRARRKREARAVLGEALEVFETLGAAGFATRASTELAATGAHVRPRSAAPDVLTPQEAQIARLAAAGERNHDIAAQLFITTSTVEYHLRKVFIKLGVSSRTQLARIDLPT